MFFYYMYIILVLKVLRTMIYNNITMTKSHFHKTTISQSWDLESVWGLLEVFFFTIYAEPWLFVFL